MLLGVGGLRIDPYFRDEPFSLTMPILNGGRIELDVVGDNQRGDVRQNVLAEEIHIVGPVGLDLRIKS